MLPQLRAKRTCIICGSAFNYRTNDKVCGDACRKVKMLLHQRNHRLKNRTTVQKSCCICNSQFATADIRTQRCENCRVGRGPFVLSETERLIQLEKRRLERETLNDNYVVALLKRQSLPVNSETIAYQKASLQLKRELEKHDEIKPYRYPVLNKQCDICGVSFNTTSRTKLRCSKNCQIEANRLMAKKASVERGVFVCKTCGKKMTHPQKGRPKFYCSVVCRNGFRKLKGNTNGK